MLIRYLTLLIRDFNIVNQVATTGRSSVTRPCDTQCHKGSLSVSHGKKPPSSSNCNHCYSDKHLKQNPFPHLNPFSPHLFLLPPGVSIIELLRLASMLLLSVLALFVLIGVLLFGVGLWIGLDFNWIEGTFLVSWDNATVVFSCGDCFNTAGELFRSSSKLSGPRIPDNVICDSETGGVGVLGCRKNFTSSDSDRSLADDELEIEIGD
jgi:hypothetical protein